MVKQLIINCVFETSVVKRSKKKCFILRYLLSTYAVRQCCVLESHNSSTQQRRFSACAQDLGFIQTFYGRLPVRTLFLFAGQSALRNISPFFFYNEQTVLFSSLPGFCKLFLTQKCLNLHRITAGTEKTQLKYVMHESWASTFYRVKPSICEPSASNLFHVNHLGPKSCQMASRFLKNLCTSVLN